MTYNLPRLSVLLFLFLFLVLIVLLGLVDNVVQLVLINVDTKLPDDVFHEIGINVHLLFRRLGHVGLSLKSFRLVCLGFCLSIWIGNHREGQSLLQLLLVIDRILIIHVVILINGGEPWLDIRVGIRGRDLLSRRVGLRLGGIGLLQGQSEGSGELWIHVGIEAKVAHRIATSSGTCASHTNISRTAHSGVLWLENRGCNHDISNVGNTNWHIQEMAVRRIIASRIGGSNQSLQS